MEKQFFLCDCCDPEHQFILSYDPEDPDYIYLEIHLAEHSFWERVKYAIRYIFGYKCRYGSFAEILINPRIAIEVKTYIEEYLNDNERTNTTGS